MLIFILKFTDNLYLLHYAYEHGMLLTFYEFSEMALTNYDVPKRRDYAYDKSPIPPPDFDGALWPQKS